MLQGNPFCIRNKSSSQGNYNCIHHHLQNSESHSSTNNMEGHSNGTTAPAGHEYPEIPHGIKALVVDHDDNARKSHEDMLISLGVETHSVKNGREALDMIFDCQKDDFKFDLILMARRMPVMDGIGATRILRLVDCTSKIVGVSTPLTDEEWEEFYNAGLNDLRDDEIPLSLQTIITICKSVPPPCNGTCHHHH